MFVDTLRANFKRSSITYHSTWGNALSIVDNPLKRKPEIDDHFNCAFKFLDQPMKGIFIFKGVVDSLVYTGETRLGLHLLDHEDLTVEYDPDIQDFTFINPDKLKTPA